MPDIFYHGILSSLIFWNHDRKKATLYGMLPDLISFGPYVIYQLFTGINFNIHDVPKWVHKNYNLGHSIFFWICLYFLIYLLSGYNEYLLLAPIISIILDIPFHSMNAYPTPFLWPLSDYKVDGITWTEPYISNLLYLFLLSFYYYRRNYN